MRRVQIIPLEPKVMHSTLFADMWRGLLLFVIVPLRLIARRPPADEKWIAELELELGMRKPKDFVGQWGDPRLITLADGGRGWRHRQAIRATFTYERIDRHSRRLQPKPKPKPAPPPSREPLVLGHDWEYITFPGAPLRDQRHAVWAQAKALIDDCAAANRSMTQGEMQAWDSLNRRLDQLDALISQQIRRDERIGSLNVQAAVEKRKAELASFSRRIAEGMRKAELGEWAEVRYVDGESVVLPATPETQAELRKRTADYERGQDEARRFLASLDVVPGEPGEHNVSCTCSRCDWRHDR